MNFNRIALGPDGRPCTIATEGISDFTAQAGFAVQCATVTEILGNLAREAGEHSKLEFVFAWGPCARADCELPYPHVPKWICTSYPVSEAFLGLLSRSANNGVSAATRIIVTQRDRCIFFTIKEAT